MNWLKTPAAASLANLSKIDPAKMNLETTRAVVRALTTGDVLNIGKVLVEGEAGQLPPVFDSRPDALISASQFSDWAAQKILWKLIFYLML